MTQSCKKYKLPIDGDFINNKVVSWIFIWTERMNLMWIVYDEGRVADWHPRLYHIYQEFISSRLPFCTVGEWGTCRRSSAVSAGILIVRITAIVQLAPAQVKIVVLLSLSRQGHPDSEHRWRSICKERSRTLYVPFHWWLLTLKDSPKSYWNSTSNMQYAAPHTHHTPASAIIHKTVRYTYKSTRRRKNRIQILHIYVESSLEIEVPGPRPKWSRNIISIPKPLCSDI